MWRVISLLSLLLGLLGSSSIARADVPYGYLCHVDGATIIDAGVSGNQYWCLAQFPGYTLTMGPYPLPVSNPAPCADGYALSSNGKQCVAAPQPPQPPQCPSPDVMAITCNALAGKHQKSGMITPTSGPGCDTGGGNADMQKCGAGCAMTTRMVVTPTASYFDHVYTGGYCKPDGSTGDGSYIPSPPANGVCPTGQVYGEVNGKPTCVNVSTSPGTQPPETQAPDTCPQGSVALISPTTGKPVSCVDPQPPGVPCPDGTYQLKQGNNIVCLGSPDKQTPSSPPGSGGSSGHSGGGSTQPGNGNGGKGNASGGSSTPGKPGDASSPGSGTCDDEFPAGLKWICGLGAGLSGPDGSDKLQTTDGGNIASMLDTTDLFGGGSCPAPYTVNVPIYTWVWNWSIDYMPICKMVLMLRPVLIASAMLLALFIIFGRRD
ncbi:virulence factor TspB C-terminal domain-related protein [Chromobacterium amazonense]|uniref:virulence factor TspB C-terminal domain-related protein n=1 Tax=Chromobacterium amazonense TaxID=1382803 RepID=UPI0011B2351F|nr:virulence factor TspB C-terminal domain-related protein [Chromobacterium amazonense]